MNKLQCELVLGVLKNMKACIDVNESYVCIDGKSFNLLRRFGICWHVYAGTPDYINVDSTFLRDVFEEMNLDRVWPVDMQLCNDTASAICHNFSVNDMYDPETKQGQLRIKLVNDLIVYFEKVLDTFEQSVV